MGLPRLTDGQYAGTSDFINAVADEIDRLGAGCIVRRATTTIIPANADYPLPWEALDLDTAGGMWSPAENPIQLTVQIPGIYEMTLQVRWGFESTGAPYNYGTRSARLMLNGTDPYTQGIAADRKLNSVSGEGVTLSMTTMAACPVGTTIFAGIRHSASGDISALYTDFGGTYLAVSRIGPLPT